MRWPALLRMNKIMISPRAWSVGVRRAFVVGLPLTVPLWIVGLCILAMLNAVVGIYRPLATFWSAPPRRVRSDYYGQSYRSERRTGRELAVVPVEKRRRR